LGAFVAIWFAELEPPVMLPLAIETGTFAFTVAAEEQHPASAALEFRGTQASSRARQIRLVRLAAYHGRYNDLIGHGVFYGRAD
jgi:hypothetical protein